MEVVIKMKWNEIIRLENEVVIYKKIFGMIHAQPYEGFQKIPHIQVSINCHYNYLSLEFV